MMRKLLTPLAFGIGLIVLTACGSSDSPATSTSAGAGGASVTSAEAQTGEGSDAATEETSVEAPQSSDAGLATGDSSLGTVVVDGAGLTAYYFDKDTKDSGVSACTGKCLDAWPPILTTSETPTVDGVTATVGTITLPDGTKQITLNGLPIYLFASDAAPGDVKGQGVNDVWWAISPNGDPIK